MKNIERLLFLLFVFGLSTLNAQQLPMYSQFFWNDFVINPAYTGVTNSPRVQLGYRNQWGGFEGAPSTYTLGGHTLLKNKKMGLGGMLFMDDAGGAVSQMGLLLNYNYILKLNEKSNLYNVHLIKMFYNAICGIVKNCRKLQFLHKLGHFATFLLFYISMPSWN